MDELKVIPTAGFDQTNLWACVTGIEIKVKRLTLNQGSCVKKKVDIETGN